MKWPRWFSRSSTQVSAGEIQKPKEDSPQKNPAMHHPRPDVSSNGNSEVPRAALNLRDVPQLPPVQQPNRFDRGFRRARIAALEMETKQYAISGWNYANRFRS